MKPCSISNCMSSVVVSIPPPEVCGLASNFTSLKSLEMDGLRTQPDPFPPFTPIDKTFSILKL